MKETEAVDSDRDSRSLPRLGGGFGGRKRFQAYISDTRGLRLAFGPSRDLQTAPGQIIDTEGYLLDGAAGELERDKGRLARNTQKGHGRQTCWPGDPDIDAIPSGRAKRENDRFRAVA